MTTGYYNPLTTPPLGGSTTYPYLFTLGLTTTTIAVTSNGKTITIELPHAAAAVFLEELEKEAFAEVQDKGGSVKINHPVTSASIPGGSLTTTTAITKDTAVKTTAEKLDDLLKKTASEMRKMVEGTGRVIENANQLPVEFAELLKNIIKRKN